MNRSFESADLARFRSIIADRLGLQFDEGKRDFIAELLHRRLDRYGARSTGTYLRDLADSDPSKELAELARDLTVAETYFLRSPEHARVLVETALPERIRTRAASRRLALLSAGCASGEEAYSLAILLREHFPELASWEIKIVGIDLNPAMVAKARIGRYCAWSLRNTPPDIRTRYFHREGQDFVLEDSIRALVSFEERNLARGNNISFWSENQFDIVLCRNVIMYLVPDAAREAIARITRALMPGSYLFLGYAETLRGLSQDYHLCHAHDAFYYRRRDRGEAVPAAPSPPARVSEPVFSGAESTDTAWMAAVRQATERIQHLSQSSAGPMTNDTSPHPAGQTGSGGYPPVQIGVVLEMLRREKFREALELLERMPSEVARDADTQLLRAVLLTNSGDPGAAEVVCRQVLLADELNSSAHYLTALCREHAGDIPGAMEHARAAIYLDDGFAMPHLHLGRLAKRARDLVTARRELREAEILLLRENSPRILLFGGGFTREALVELSRSEFRTCGGVA